MHLDLSEEDARMFESVLQEHLTRLRREVARTDAHDFRHELVKRLDVCERVLEQLGQAAPTDRTR